MIATKTTFRGGRLNIATEVIDEKPNIFVVDSDDATRRTMATVAHLLDMNVTHYSTAEQFLAVYDPRRPGCLVFEFQLPEMTGIELQVRLKAMASSLPSIGVGRGLNVPIAVQAMRAGAIAVIEKPFPVDEMTQYVREASLVDNQRRREMRWKLQVDSQLERLTKKEHEVLDLVVEGNTNKEIAAHLNLSIRAVEDRRSRLMKKMGARSVVDLVRLKVQT